jgi:hypothetical protein
MKRWSGWVERLNNMLSPEFKGSGKKEALRKTGIGYHEVVAGHIAAGELRRLVEKLVPGR